MAKKWICTVCGYVHEGDTPPEKCPQCKQPAEKFKELKEDAEVNYAAEHVVGVAKGVDPEILDGLKAHFEGECSEVGMYLAMARQADREGYPEIAEAFKRYAFEEADHASRFAELLGEVVWDTKTNLEKRMAAEAGWTPSTTPFTRWHATRLVTDKASPACTTASSRSNPHALR